MSTTEAISVVRPRIRTAEPSDADTVFGLLEQLGEPFVPERSAFDETYAQAVQPGGDNMLYVAETDAGVVGYAFATIARLLYTNGDSAQLQELVVDESARNAGIGSQLVVMVEDECRRRGARQLTVASIRGAAFYERLDYRSTADYLKKVFDE